MTCREKFEMEHQGSIIPVNMGCSGCPSDYGYMDDPEDGCYIDCDRCWDREIPETEPAQQTENNKPINFNDADEVYALYKRYVDAGFERDQAFDIVKELVLSAFKRGDTNAT